METNQHGYDSGSLQYEEMQCLLDVIAAQCLKLEEDIRLQRDQLDKQQAEVNNMRRLTKMVERQVQAGQLAVESAVGMLRGAA